MQQQNPSKQHRYENWFKQGYKQRSLKKKLTPPDVPKTVISTDRHEAAEITIPHNLNMLIERHNDEKVAITLLIV